MQNVFPKKGHLSITYEKKNLVKFNKKVNDLILDKRSEQTFQQRGSRNGKHYIGRSASLVSREARVKSPQKCLCAHPREANTGKTGHLQGWRGGREAGTPSHTCWWEHKMAQPTWKTGWPLSEKSGIHLSRK